MSPAADSGTAHRLSTLLEGVAGVGADQDRDIAGLCMDSRQARPGDLFFACAGTRAHGIDYLDEALRAGIAALAWEASEWCDEAPPPALGGGVPIPAFAIKDLSNRIGVIADRFYGHPSRDLQVIGITGTDGKTSCSQFIGSCLDSDRARCGVIGTLGYGLYGQLEPATHTTPDAIRVHELLARMRDRGARYAVMEVSSHGLAQGRVNGVAFDMAVLTNLTRDHLDYHGHEVAYARAKRRLFEQPGLRAAVLNLNDEFGRELLDVLPEAVERVGYGLEPLPPVAVARRVVGSELHLHQDGFSMQVGSPWGEGRINSRLLGRFNASNVLAVLTVLLLCGLSFEQARAGLERLTTVPGRMERFGGGARQVLVIVDYAHTPDALRHVLQALRAHCGGRLWCVFGCGGDRDRGKRPLMGAVAERLADRVVVTDDNPRGEDPERIVAEILAGMQAPRTARIERDRARAIAFAVSEARPDDLVLVAGKGHEEYQLVGTRKLPFSDREQVRRLVEGAQ